MQRRARGRKLRLASCRLLWKCVWLWPRLRHAGGLTRIALSWASDVSALFALGFAQRLPAGSSSREPDTGHLEQWSGGFPQLPPCADQSPLPARRIWPVLCRWAEGHASSSSLLHDDSDLLLRFLVRFRVFSSDRDSRLAYSKSPHAKAWLSVWLVAEKGNDVLV